MALLQRSLACAPSSYVPTLCLTKIMTDGAEVKVSYDDSVANTSADTFLTSQPIATASKPVPDKVGLYPSDDEEEEEVLSHKMVMERFQDGLAEIILGDPLLNDLPTRVTVEEIQSQIALEYGQAMTVNVRRGDDVVMPVVVVQSATVMDLKKAIARFITLKLVREDMDRKINWTYVWKSYWLYFEGQKLSADTKTLKDYGIRNKDEVTFIKRLKQK